MPKKINDKYPVSFRVDSKLYENFDFKYGVDVLKPLFMNVLEKCIDRKDLLEFLLFDDVNDFNCIRSLGGIN